MLGPFKNRGIADAFKQLDEVQSKSSQCFVIAGLVVNAHDLTQEQLDHLALLLCSPWKPKLGAPKLEARNWKLIKLIRKNYAETGIIPTQKEVLEEILKQEKSISDNNSARAIFKQIKNYIFYIPTTIGRPKKI